MENVDHVSFLFDQDCCCHVVHTCTFMYDDDSCILMTVFTRSGWVEFRDYEKILCGEMFPLMLKWAAYKAKVWPVIPYGIEA